MTLYPFKHVELNVAYFTYGSHRAKSVLKFYCPQEFLGFVSTEKSKDKVPLPIPHVSKYSYVTKRSHSY